MVGYSKQELPYVTPPGSTLRDELEARDMSQTELAARLGMAKQTISKIISGKAPISEDTAIGLERVFGVPAYFWSVREADYRTYLQKKEQREKLAEFVDWVSNFPYREMAALSWVTDTRKRIDRLLSLLSFLGINSPAEWQALFAQKKYAAFRSSAVAGLDEYALGAWLTQGERLVQERQLGEYSPAKLRTALFEMRRLTTESPVQAVMGLFRLCSKAGVLLALVPSLPKLGVWGASRWLSADKPMIQLSSRYKFDDHFWFTFFHEVFHVLLHRSKTIFEFDAAGSASNPLETEANEAASELLIPAEKYWPFFDRNEPKTRERVIAFARELDIAPGIVVGRLQREKRVSYSNVALNDLKRDYSAIFQTVA